MVTSIDGKVIGEFLSRPECESATEIYYEMNREYKAQGSGGFICGRVTMEGSFTGGWYPDLSKYKPVEKCLGHYMNCWFDDLLRVTIVYSDFHSNHLISLITFKAIPCIVSSRG